MLTQEKKDIKDRLNALPKDDRNEIIASLGIDADSACKSYKGESNLSRGNRLTWEKFNTFLLLVYGGVILGTACSDLRGGAVGAAIAVLYSWYIFNNKADRSQSPNKSC
jgi:hypothetical protein